MQVSRVEYIFYLLALKEHARTEKDRTGICSLMVYHSGKEAKEKSWTTVLKWYFQYMTIQYRIQVGHSYSLQIFNILVQIRLLLLMCWDAVLLSVDYVQNVLLLSKRSFFVSTPAFIYVTLSRTRVKDKNKINMIDDWFIRFDSVKSAERILAKN